MSIFGMGIGSAVAIYFIIWWVLFFAVLPWGRRDPDPEAERVAGADRGAPARPLLWRKVIITTVGAVVLYLGLVALLNSGVTLDDIPMPSGPT